MIQYPNPINTNNAIISIILFCDSGGIRTPNQQSRNLPFYPVELRSHVLEASVTTFTLAASPKTSLNWFKHVWIIFYQEF